jgi:hypothetical protein
VTAAITITGQFDVLRKPTSSLMTLHATNNSSILWRGIYRPGHEACRLFPQNTEWHLEGAAVFSHDHQPCELSYLVVCDAQWNTRRGNVSGWLGNAIVNLEISAGGDHHWSLNGVEQPNIAGCIDLDLNFSPSTNLLPIRRLNLGIGQESEVKAAWLRFPSFEFEALSQVYKRIDEFTYHYESDGGKFVADLKVNTLGFVTNYPGIWQAEQG